MKVTRPVAFLPVSDSRNPFTKHLLHCVVSTPNHAFLISEMSVTPLTHRGVFRLASIFPARDAKKGEVASDVTLSQ